MITETKAKAIVLREAVSIGGYESTRFASEDWFTLYACHDETGRLYCVSIRGRGSPTCIFYADDVQAVVL